MQVFAVLELRADASKDELTRVIEEEELYLWREVVSDRVRSVWSLRERLGGIALLEVKDPEEAQAVISAMPAVRSGLVAFTLEPVGPFRGWEVLFKSGVKS